MSAALSPVAACLLLAVSADALDALRRGCACKWAWLCAARAGVVAGPPGGRDCERRVAAARDDAIVELHWTEDYRFDVHFQPPGMPALMTDLAPPLGKPAFPVDVQVFDGDGVHVGPPPAAPGGR